MKDHHSATLRISVRRSNRRQWVSRNNKRKKINSQQFLLSAKTEIITLANRTIQLLMFSFCYCFKSAWFMSQPRCFPHYCRSLCNDVLFKTIRWLSLKMLCLSSWEKLLLSSSWVCFSWESLLDELKRLLALEIAVFTNISIGLKWFVA